MLSLNHRNYGWPQCMGVILGLLVLLSSWNLSAQSSQASRANSFLPEDAGSPSSPLSMLQTPMAFSIGSSGDHGQNSGTQRVEFLVTELPGEGAALAAIEQVQRELGAPAELPIYQMAPGVGGNSQRGEAQQPEFWDLSSLDKPAIQIRYREHDAPPEVTSGSVAIDLQVDSAAMKKTVDNEVEAQRVMRRGYLVVTRFVLVGGGTLTTLTVVQGLGLEALLPSLLAGGVSAWVMANYSAFSNWMTSHGLFRLSEHQTGNLRQRGTAFAEPFLKWYAIEFALIAAVQLALEGGQFLATTQALLSDPSFFERLTAIAAAALAGTFTQGSWEAFIGVLAKKIGKIDSAELVKAQTDAKARSAMVRRQIRIANWRDSMALVASAISTTLALGYASGVPALEIMGVLGVTGVGAYGWVRMFYDPEKQGSRMQVGEGRLRLGSGNATFMGWLQTLFQRIAADPRRQMSRPQLLGSNEGETRPSGKLRCNKVF